VKLCGIYIYIYIYIIYCILHVYISYIFKYILNFLMFMNLTIHDAKRFTIHNISSPIHYLYLDSTTMYRTTMAKATNI